MSNEYLQEVAARLYDNPTASELDFFLVAHARVGQLVAQARYLADEAEEKAKVHYSTSYLEARRDGAKSAADADARARIAASPSEGVALSAKEKYQKLNALYRSIEETINGIKFLGRNDGTMTLPRR